MRTLGALVLHTVDVPSENVAGEIRSACFLAVDVLNENVTESSPFRDEIAANMNPFCVLFTYLSIFFMINHGAFCHFLLRMRPPPSPGRNLADPSVQPNHRKALCMSITAPPSPPPPAPAIRGSSRSWRRQRTTLPVRMVTDER